MNPQINRLGNQILYEMSLIVRNCGIKVLFSTLLGRLGCEIGGTKSDCTEMDNISIQCCVLKFNIQNFRTMVALARE
jgi:hypothetical protein